MKIFNTMFPNNCSRNKRRKNCQESRWRSQSALVRPLAMSCLSRCQDLIGSLASTHSTFNLIGSCNTHPNIQSYRDTKLQRYKATKIHTLTPLTYELFFQNSSISDLPCAQAYSHFLEVQSKFSRYKSRNLWQGFFGDSCYLIACAQTKLNSG